MERIWTWFDALSLALEQAKKRRDAERALAQLDAHTLKDVGLEPWNIARVGRTAEQQRELMRAATSRIGLY